jgi:BioD-like phosphotransacetylase family protein
MATLLVASDQGGAGKTALCAGLAAEMRQRGHSVSVLKPFTAENGSQPDADVQAFGRLLGEPVSGEPVRVGANGLPPGAIDAAVEARNRALEGRELAVVEAASALSEAETAQAAEALDASVVLVSGSGPDVDASALGPWRSALGDRLLGVVVNGLTRYMGHDTSNRLVPEIRSHGIATLGVIPEDRSLLSVTVGDIASHLGGNFILNEDEDGALVEHIMIGGLGMDSGTLYFSLHRSKAVVVRGDRPDIQMAALATPTACMVLTMGIPPIEYVLNEAELEEVPLIVVDPGTIETMDALATLQDNARFDHPAKLERMSELVRRHVDLEAIERGMGMANGTAQGDCISTLTGSET